MASASRTLHERLARGEAEAKQPYAKTALRERPERFGQRLKGVGLGVEREVHDDQVDARVTVGGRRRGDGLQAGIRIDADVDRAGDLVHIPADRGAVTGQDFLQLEPLLRALR